MLGVSVSGDHAWRERPDSARRTANRQLLGDIQRLCARHHGRHGSPRVHAAPCAEGRTLSRGRIERLMRAARRFRPAATDSHHARPVAPNLLDRQCVAAAPNQVWLADLTCLHTGEGWLYLAAVLDLASREVVGWSMRAHLRAELTCAALMMATQRQPDPPPGLLPHSGRTSLRFDRDRGGHYAADDYRTLLGAAGTRHSMSRRGTCYDNAPMASFFHTLTVELAHQRRWATRDDARRDVFAYVESYYTRQRIHPALG